MVTPRKSRVLQWRDMDRSATHHYLSRLCDQCGPGKQGCSWANTVSVRMRAMWEEMTDAEKHRC